MGNSDRKTQENSQNWGLRTFAKNVIVGEHPTRRDGRLVHRLCAGIQFLWENPWTWQVIADSSVSVTAQSIRINQNYTKNCMRRERISVTSTVCRPAGQVSPMRNKQENVLLARGPSRWQYHTDITTPSPAAPTTSYWIPPPGPGRDRLVFWSPVIPHPSCLPCYLVTSWLSAHSSFSA